jgi:putative transposase
MSHPYARNYLHVVFSTNERRKVIRGEQRQQLWSYMRAVGDECGVQPLRSAARKTTYILWLRCLPRSRWPLGSEAVKRKSSAWMNENGHLFAWQQGYGAFSVSASKLDGVCKFVREQEKHHSKLRFEDEFTALLMKHGVEFTIERVFG